MSIRSCGGHLQGRGTRASKIEGSTARLMLTAITLGLSANHADATMPRMLSFVGQCARFAREASGIDIRGDAWTWWQRAEGRYARGHRPRVGAVAVFARSSKLPLGHVAVISRLVERRVVMLTHANWSRQNGERGHVEQDVTLFDVSTDNDWSVVKVWFRDAQGLGGTSYPLSGFVYPSPHAANNLSSVTPDDVGALIDAYVSNRQAAVRPAWARAAVTDR